MSTHFDTASDANYITADEIAELNILQKQQTLNLKHNMANATFYGFKDLQKLESELKDTSQPLLQSARMVQEYQNIDDGTQSGKAIDGTPNMNIRTTSGLQSALKNAGMPLNTVSSVALTAT